MAMIVLKPVVVPKYIELNAICTRAVKRTAYTGTALDETLEKTSENGRPLSREKAYTAREPSAISELAHTVAMIAIIEASVDVPAILPVELNMISITGTPVAVEPVASRSPMQKQRAINQIKPVKNPIYTDMIMARGACFRAFLISSVMCEGAS
jgi:hypothetical protein